ncbi:MAG TPA: ATP-dependent protease ATPase subunit HslU [Longimicrobiaceae bacterium]|nr:ATP-dependent protease ATPase subunit HslU [Longimicrobiaceae bacterium]
MSEEAKQDTAPETQQEQLWLDEMTPRQIVAELDKYIVGQEAAKKSVAIALRNRWRRQRVGEDLRDEIVPNNIVMIGPTGVGKTEIARRLARLAGAPFVKVEASKFTEVGYVGRDVESMIRDLVDMAINMVRTEREDEVQEVAEQRVEERILDLLLPPVGDGGKPGSSPAATLEERFRAFVVSPAGQVEDRRAAEEAKASPAAEGEDREMKERRERTREKFRQLLRDEKLEDREVEVEVQQSFPMENMMVPLGGGGEGMDNFSEMLQEFLPKRTKRRQVTVAEARRILLQDELDKLVNMDEVVDEALERSEQMGIVFLDEIDKIAGDRSGVAGPDVSREGVQRDLLPIVEGSTVQTKYGMVRTDHMLFIAAGAFHVSKPSDLIPELQGRFPIRVELNNLTERDFVRILREPKNALLTQYGALVAADGASLEFTDDGVEAIARTAATVNDRMENIGARRLHTVLTTLLEDILFDLPDAAEKQIVIDAGTVRSRLKAIVEDEDLRKYIL